MTWAAYPEYTESGSEWLGAVPSTWVPLRLKNIIKSVESGTSVNSGDWSAAPDEVGVLKTSCVSTGRFNPAANKVVVAEEISRVTCPVKKETLIVNRANTPLLVGSAGYVHQDLPGIYLSDKLWQVRFDGALAAFVYYWTLTNEYRSQIAARCVGASSSMQNLSVSDFREVAIALPPYREQRLIADFLDTQTAKIDALICKQEQLVATLREDRNSTIATAVTKGVDPAAEMQDSGVDSLPTIPASWVATPLKHVCLVRDCKHLTAQFVDDGYPLASIREVQSRYVDLTNAKRTTEAYYKQLSEGGRSPQPGDLIFSRNATVGEVAQVNEQPEPFAMGQDVCLLRPSQHKLNPDYVWYVLRSQLVRTQIDLLMIGSTFKRINVEEIKSLVVTCPPLAEQQQIVDFLVVRCGEIEALIAKAQDVVGTLREYRSALITDAVMGKIDVRDAVG